MQRLPQHGNDSVFALFHTPHLCNIGWYNWAMTTSPENNPTTLETIAESLSELDKFVRTFAVGTVESWKNLETKFDGLRTDVDGLTNRVDGLTAKVGGLADDIAMVKGGHARNAMRQNLYRIADEFGFEFISEVPQAAIIGFSKVATAQGEAANEAESFRNADMVMNVRNTDGQPGYVALEASFTVNGNDVRRAVRNADYLHQYTGLPCYAAVAGVEVLPEAQEAINAGEALLYRIPARELQSE